MSAQSPSQVRSLWVKATPLVKHLRAGKVYRREDLMPYSTSVDRELQQLVTAGRLTKAAHGLYYAPRKSVFGDAPPDEKNLLAAFLKDTHFLSFNPSIYNSLRLGTTQLYNKSIVYNHKRHGKFRLGNREYDFRIKHRFPLPTQITPEYLLVDMLNNLDELAEDEDQIFAIAQRKLPQFNARKLHQALHDYGAATTRRLMKNWLNALNTFPSMGGK